MDFITVPLTTYIVFAAIYGIFDLLIRRRERMAVIEKMGDKLDLSLVEGKMNLCGSFKGFSFNSLKIGCLLTGLGIGLLTGFCICTQTVPNYVADYPYMTNTIGIVYGASLLLFGGIGLLTAFLVEMKIVKKN